MSRSIPPGIGRIRQFLRFSLRDWLGGDEGRDDHGSNLHRDPDDNVAGRLDGRERGRGPVDGQPDAGYGDDSAPPADRRNKHSRGLLLPAGLSSDRRGELDDR